LFSNYYFHISVIDENKKIVYNDLFVFLRTKGPLNPRSVVSNRYLLQYIKQKYNADNWEEEYENKIKSTISNFTAVLSKLWIKSSRNIIRFKESNVDWLKKLFVLPPRSPPSSLNVGRPQKLFPDCSDRNKRRKIQQLTKSYTSPEILFAAKNKLHMSGKRAACSIVNESLSSPTRASKIKKSYMASLSIDNAIMPYSFDEALAFFIENKLTKQQYINIRKSAKERRANIYPSYDNVLTAKKKCYPENIHVTESYFKIELQHLLDHTITRLFLISDIPPVDLTMNNFEILCKWGCDGSSSQARYKQITSSNFNDSDIFMFSLVPLQLRCTKINNPKTILLWKNPRPSSTRYCRPIKFEYKKETIESTLEEVNAVEEEIKSLIPT